jgi:hypothetical protein
MVVKLAAGMGILEDARPSKCSLTPGEHLLLEDPNLAVKTLPRHVGEWL